MTTTPYARASPALPVSASKRSVLSTIHLWLGLSLGGLLVLFALSGSAMIFRFELERLVFPSLTHTSRQGAMHLDTCLAAAQAVNPQKTVRTLRLPTATDGTLEWLTIPAGQTTKEQATTVYTDPHTCTVLGTRGPGKDLMSFLVDFHHALFLGRKAAWLQSCIAATGIFMAISGLILWWPRTWAWSRLRPRASARPLHYFVGFWAMWPLLLATTTALYMTWRSGINTALLGQASAGSAAPKAGKGMSGKPTVPRPATAPLSLDEALLTARSARPDATFRILTLPQSSKAAITITYQLPGDYGRAGNNQLSIAQTPDGTPHIASITELRYSSRTKRFLIGLSQIHYGEFGGMATRLLMCATGFMPAVLFLSGLTMYRQRLRTREIMRKSLRR